MCNDYRLLTNAAAIFEVLSELRDPPMDPLPRRDKPNLEAREDIKIID